MAAKYERAVTRLKKFRIEIGAAESEVDDERAEDVLIYGEVVEGSCSRGVDRKAVHVRKYRIFVDAGDRMYSFVLSS